MNSQATRNILTTKRKKKRMKGYGVLCGTLNHTKDYWCRDYMPIQVSDTKYVRYMYAPDYLMNKHDRAYITNPDAVLAELGIETVRTQLVIDGGGCNSISWNIRLMF